MLSIITSFTFTLFSSLILLFIFLFTFSSFGFPFTALSFTLFEHWEKVFAEFFSSKLFSHWSKQKLSSPFKLETDLQILIWNFFQSCAVLSFLLSLQNNPSNKYQELWGLCIIGSQTLFSVSMNPGKLSPANSELNVNNLSQHKNVTLSPENRSSQNEENTEKRKIFR